MKSLLLAAVLLGGLVLSGCEGAVFGTRDRGSNPLERDPHKSKVLVGPSAGFSRNFHSGGFKTIDDPLCGEFRNGAGSGYALGFSAEYPVRPSLSVIARVSFEQRPGSFRQELAEADVIPTGAEQALPERIAVTSSISYSLADLDLQIRQGLVRLGRTTLGVAAGISGAIVVGGDNSQMERLETPENARLINPYDFPSDPSGRALTLYDGPIPGRNQWRASLQAGVVGEVPLFDDAWLLSPGLYYDFGVTDVTGLESWQLNSIIVMVDLRHAF